MRRFLDALAEKVRRGATQQVAIPEHGMSFEVRALTRAELLWIAEKCVQPRTGRTDGARVDRETVVRGTVAPKISSAEYDELADSPLGNAIINRLVRAIQELSAGLPAGTESAEGEGDEEVEGGERDPLAAAEARFR
jgi:hypothetical protein